MLAIIDGDVLAYNCCKPRWEKKAQFITRVVEDSYYEGKSSEETISVRKLDADGKTVPLEFTRDEDTKYLMDSWENFKKDLDLLLGTVFCDDYIMAVKGVDNFRDRLFSEYKKNRTSKSNVNLFVPTIRELAVHEGYAIPANGREADDLLSIWAHEARAAGREYIVCSIDKDLKCIPGTHYLIHKKTILEVSEFEAMSFHYQQLLSGDSTDNIPGLPGIGPIKAQGILSGCITEADFQERVVEHYIAFFEDEWKQYLLSNGKMIYLQKHYNDYFTLENWPLVKELDGV